MNNVLNVYNCIHEEAIKPSCILYLDEIVENSHQPVVNFHHWFHILSISPVKIKKKEEKTAAHNDMFLF